MKRFLYCAFNMQAYTPSHVFASVTSKQNIPQTTNHPNIDRENLYSNSRMNVGLKNNESSDRFIKVTAVGEVSLPPDRCRVSVKVHSQKDNVQDVKNSVQRRLDYVLQTFQNHSVKVYNKPFVLTVTYSSMQFLKVLCL